MEVEEEKKSILITKKKEIPITFIRFRLSNIDTISSNLKYNLNQFDTRNSPWSKNEKEGLNSVPVIRIFGATDRGQRVVAHIHGTFPYLYVEYKGSLDPEIVNSYIYKFGKALDSAASALSITKNNQEAVAFISICKGTAFYGYHVGYSTFLKIYLCSPTTKKRLAEVLRSGSIMGTAFEVFEDHIPFILQFMLDQNVFGCGWVEVSDCKFRLPLPEHIPSSYDQLNKPSCDGPIATRIYNDASVPKSRQHRENHPSKVSYCALEIDLPIDSIVNRYHMIPRDLHADFVELLRPEEVQKGKLVNSVKELWDDENRRRLAKGGSRLFEGEELGSARDIDLGITREWESEEKLRIDMEIRAKEDLRTFKSKITRGGISSDTKDKKKKLSPELDSYVETIEDLDEQEQDWKDQIRTTFESVDSVYPTRMKLDEINKYPFGAWAVHSSKNSIRIVKKTNSSKEGEKSEKAQGKEREVKEEEEILPDFDETLWKATQAVRPVPPEEDSEDDENTGNGIFNENAGSATPEVEEDDWYQQEEAGEANPAVESDAEGDGEPSAKRARRAESTTSSSLPPRGPSITPAPSPAKPLSQNTPNKAIPVSAPSSRPKNPFTSPDKPSRFRKALPVPVLVPSISTSPYASPNISDGEEETVENGISSPPPNQTTEVISDNYDDLPSDTFDDYFPSPTFAAPGPEEIPNHMRSFVIHPTQSSSSSKGEMVIPSSTGTDSTSSASPIILSQTDLEDEDEDEDDDSMDVDNDKAQEEVSLEPSPFLATPTIVFSADSSFSSAVDSAVMNPLQGVPSSSVSKSASIHNYPLSTNSYTWKFSPPTTKQLFASLENSSIPHIVYNRPFYSNPQDVPQRPKEYGGRSFRLLGNTIQYLPKFIHWDNSDLSKLQVESKKPIRSDGLIWEFNKLPPSKKMVMQWLEEERVNSEKVDHTRAIGSQIEGPTQLNRGYENIPLKGSTSNREPQHISVLAIELHVNTRGKLLPDPAIDEISAIFYCYQSEDLDRIENGRSPDRHVGVIAVDPTGELAKKLGKSDSLGLGETNCHLETESFGKPGYTLRTVASELDLINDFIDKVRQWDPEIAAGFDVYHSSWGYLVERADKGFNWDLVAQLGRVSSQGTGKTGTAATDRWGHRTTSTLHLTGRHTYQIWRMLKGEVNLSCYTFESLANHFLHRRVPRFSAETLTTWCRSGIVHQIARVFDYYLDRVEMDIELLEEGEIVNNNCEAARVFGIDLESVKTRGSQFKVEAVMLRISKPESFLLLSPNRPQVGKQNAAECQPLIMEPQSAFYNGPLVVLDFQSLYPSVMIAYNFCYSTCLGRIGTFKGTRKLGVSNLELPPGLLHLLKDQVNVSPNGIMFVKPEVRKSLLAKMLSELLDTRVMVKNGMKAASGNKGLLKMLNARQLALKFIANVTYGYCGATFSGRMPCVEMADAIVQTGRETLEKAIKTVHATERWGAEVVYGDTDSLFIYLPGRSKEEAFRIGNEMAEKITSENPRPVKLKFEKVYLPCVLLAKKRYVGFKYEKEADIEPDFDAKGIETVRRDMVPATQKMQEACLKILFRTADLSLVKEYCQRQWRKLATGEASPQDFIYAKEVKMGTYSEKVNPPPGAVVAGRREESDFRDEAAYGERIPYVIIRSEDRLQVNRALSPAEFLADSRLQLDVTHYITKTSIPPLERIFNLLGADVNSWYTEMRGIKGVSKRLATDGKPILLEEHFTSDRCVSCHASGAPDGLCKACVSRPGDVAYSLMNRYKKVSARRNELHRICSSCSATPMGEDVKCESIDCSVYFARIKTDHEERGVAEVLVEWDKVQQ